MRKKILAVVTAAVLALGCFATVSAEAGDTTKSAQAALLTEIGNGTANDLTAGVKPNAAEKKAAKEMVKGSIFSLGHISLDYTQETKDEYQLYGLGVDWTDTASVQTMFNMLTHLYAQKGTEKVIRVFRIESDDADASSPVKVTIADSAVKANKKYALRHFKDGVWDNTSAKVTSVVDGVVYGEITKASPFALVELAGSAAPAANDTTATKNATGTKTAPKTGEV